MAITFQRFIDRAVLQATHGLTPQAAELISSDGVAESLCSEVFREVSEECAGDERLRHMLRKTKSISLAAGIGTLTDDVLTKYFDESCVNDPNDLTKAERMTWEPQYMDFIRPQMTVLNGLGSYTIKGERALHWRDPNEVYDGTLQMTGTVQLITPCIVVVPATAATNVDAPDEIIDLLIGRLAARLRGMIPA